MNHTPRATVGINQLTRPRRSPLLMALTANCMVTLDRSRNAVLIATSGTGAPKIGVTEFQWGFSQTSTQRWKIGSHSGTRARRKKYVVKRARKNMASLDTKRMQAH